MERIVSCARRVRLYFLRSKLRATARWLKHVVTFDNWLDYIARKVERRTGMRMEIGPWERRLPYLLLFEEGRGRIVLIDADNHDQPILLQTEALEAHWSPNGETRLLYTNGFETHLFYPQTLGDTLIDRMSRSVASVAWHPSGTAIVLAHQDGVVAYDLHEPGFIQTKLNDAQEISRVFIESPGGRLLFLGTVDGVYGLYQQTIR